MVAAAFKSHLRTLFALTALVVGVGVLPYLPASAGEPANDIEKSGVAQSPAGSTTETLENTLIDWTINYKNESDTIQTDGKVSDTTTSNLKIIPESVQQPPGWTPTITGNNQIDFNAPVIVPKGKGFVISTKPTSKTLNGGQGGGDGYVPLFGSDGRIYFTYHHTDGTIQCIDPDTGAVCAGYPIAMTVNSGGVSGRMWSPNPAEGATVIGTRLYQAGIVAGTPAYTYGLGCWDLVARTNCADQPYITFPHPAGFANASGNQSHTFVGGPFVVGDNMYSWTSHQEVQCVNRSTWATCAGSWPKNMRNDATFPRVAANGIGAGELLGSKLFYAWAYGVSTETPTQVAGVRVSCFDTTTAATCAGWADSSGNPDGKAMSSNNGNIWDIYFRYDAGGTPNAVCQTSYTNTAGCNSLVDGSQIADGPNDVNGVPNALYNKIHYNGTSSGVISQMKHPDLNRTYFSTYPLNNEVCWDWGTGDFCTTPSTSGDLNYIDTAPGDGYVGDGGRIRPGSISTTDYGARLDTRTGCWWSLGDANVLWSFDDLGNAPCIPRLVEASGSNTFSGSFCRTGVPQDLAWTKSTTTNFDPNDWVGFTVTIKDGSATVGTYNPKNGELSLDLSGVDAQSVDTLSYEINGSMAPGRTPLEDPATTPMITIEYATATGVQFCYQTKTVGDPCVDTVAHNNATFKIGTGPVEDTSTRSFDVIADPVGKCFTPKVTLAKTVYTGHNNGDGCAGAETALIRSGDDVTWCFSVTNTGDTDLDQVEISDPDLPGSPFAITGKLAQGASTSIFVEGAAGSADLTNTAAVTGRPVYPDGNPIPGATPPGDEDTAEYEVRDPQLKLAKTAYAGHDGGASCATATEIATIDGGGDVTWCFTVTNTGDTPLADVRVADPDLPGSPFTIAGTIAPNHTGGTYAEGTSSADLTNTATATGSPADLQGTPVPGLPKVTDDDTAEVDTVAPSLTLAKTVVAGTECPGTELATVDEGDPVTWCFAVKNTGDTHLTNASVADPDLPGSPFAVPGTIAPDGTASISVAGTATADLTNTASASAAPSDDNGGVYPKVTPPTDEDTAEIDVVSPGISIEKTVLLGDDGDSCPGVETIHSLDDVDDAIVWCFTVKNTGDTQLVNVSITDPDLPGSPFAVGDLDAGASATKSVPGSATTNLTNTASVSGTPADGHGVVLPDADSPTDDDTASIVEDAAASAGGRLFVDHNADGDDEAGGDDGLGGVEVTITGTDVNGKEVSVTVSSNPDGSYSFGQLLPSGPDGYSITVNRDTVPSKYTFDTTSLTQNVDVAAGDNTPLNPMGVAQPAAIDGRVFADSNGDGDVDNGERGVGGVGVTLAGTDAKGRPVTLETTTKSDGSYSFGDLFPSDDEGYTVTLDETTVPSQFTGVSTATNDTLVVGSGQTTEATPFGLTAPGSLSGSVFEDVDADGTDEATDRDLGGVRVTVSGLDAQGHLVAFETVTNPDGTYSFPELPPSGPDGYAVAVDTDTLPPGIRTPSTPLTRDVPVTSGSEGSVAPMGVYAPAAASGTVFTDFDSDATQDSGEAGIGGVTVTLEGRDGKGNKVLVSTVTNPDGSYDFAGLPPSGPDGYAIKVDRSTLPPGSGEITTASSHTITPTSGSADADLDFGVFSGADVTGQVFIDPDADGTVDRGEAGLGGVKVTLTGTDVNGNLIRRTVVTGTDGTYTFADIPPSDGTGYEVAVDASTVPAEYSINSTPQASTVSVVAGTDTVVEPFGVLEPATIKGILYNDANGNGRQDPGEPGIANAEIRLTGTDIQGNPVDRTVVTGADGSYDFGDLLPSDAAGYTITVNPDTVPAGLTLVGGNESRVLGAGDRLSIAFRAVAADDSTTTPPPTTGQANPTTTAPSATKDQANPTTTAPSATTGQVNPTDTAQTPATASNGAAPSRLAATDTSGAAPSRLPATGSNPLAVAALAAMGIVGGAILLAIRRRLRPVR
ncbi:MAG: SdrD B-like domain-containing protein [Microthrixaceae bacterium]